MIRARAAAVLVALGASGLLAAPAAALSPPELFVRLQPWATHEPVSDWIPLASAPALDYLGGYEIGFRLQPSAEPNGFQRAALQVTGVPDGAPTQPGVGEPYCVGRAGAAGTIVPAGAELQFEGVGSYTVKVSLGPGSGDAKGCLAEPSAASASFSVGAAVAPSLFGKPLSFRAAALPGDPFVGVQAPDPRGGFADVRCALDAALRPDGSVAGRLEIPDGGLRPKLAEGAFRRPGAWTCVARGFAEGRTESLEQTVFGTPWSAPLRFEVQSDFRFAVRPVAAPRSSRPRLTFVAEWPAEAEGGRVTLTLQRITGCTGRRFRLRTQSVARGRFGPRRMTVALKRQAPGYLIGRLRFSGTRFLRPGVDTRAIGLVADRKGLRLPREGEGPTCAG